MLHAAVCAEYNSATDLAFKRAAEEACMQMDTEVSMVELSSTGCASWRKRVDSVCKAAKEGLTDWTLAPADRKILLQPIRSHGDMLTLQLVRLSAVLISSSNCFHSSEFYFLILHYRRRE